MTKHDQECFKRYERKLLRINQGSIISERDLYNEADIVHLIKAKRLQWMGHVVRSDVKSLTRVVEWKVMP